MGSASSNSVTAVQSVDQTASKSLGQAVVPTDSYRAVQTSDLNDDRVDQLIRELDL